MNEQILQDCIRKCSQTVNAGIFVDFDNIYYGLREYGVDPGEPQYCVFSLMERIYSADRIRTLRAYADYDQVGVSLKHLQEMRVQIKNVYGNGLEEEYRKNASDIELSVDALEIFYRSPEIDTFVFLTSDSDMIPIMSRLMYKGKRIHLFCIDDNTSHYQDLSHFCHVKCDLLALFEIDPDRKSPEYWLKQALREIENWYARHRNSELMLGGKWLNRLLCDKLNISSRAASRMILYMKENDYIYEFQNNAGHMGYRLTGQKEIAKKPAADTDPTS